MEERQKQVKRCFWANPKNPLYIKYHDEEWGQPVHDDAKLLELLILECFQAGLSWECVLNKREAFREAFDGFDRDTILAYDEKRLMSLCPPPESFAIEQKSRQRYLTLQFSSLFRKNLVRLMLIFQACVPKSLFSTIRPQPPQFQMPCQPTCVKGA